MKRIFTTSILSFLVLFSVAQETGTVKGTVKDKESGETIIGASVVWEADKGRGAATDFDGNFTLMLPAGDQKIIITSIGYDAKTIPVTVKAGETTTVQGFAGGAGRTTAGDRAGGGGGGAGAVGVAGSSPRVGGAGGAGVSTSINASSVQRAGGGGGTGQAGTQSGVNAGGAGGGGAGACGGSPGCGTPGTAGSANTGGGGGAANSNVANNAGFGGSGLVIIRYKFK